MLAQAEVEALHEGGVDLTAKRAQRQLIPVILLKLPERPPRHDNFFSNIRSYPTSSFGILNFPTS
jgi:hypothetical protein